MSWFLIRPMYLSFFTMIHTLSQGLRLSLSLNSFGITICPFGQILVVQKSFISHNSLSIVI